MLSIVNHTYLFIISHVIIVIREEENHTKYSSLFQTCYVTKLKTKPNEGVGLNLTLSMHTFPLTR